MGLNIQTPEIIPWCCSCEQFAVKQRSKGIIPVSAATIIGPGARRNMMTRGRKKVCVTRMRFRDQAKCGEGKIPNFGTSIFTQTFANTPSI
jgi:hypothetical protein